MTVHESIRSKLEAGLEPLHLEVHNESHMHNVPPGSESHFRLVVVSREFEGKPLVQRHRTVNRLLGTELDAQVHALAMEVFTPEEWDTKAGRTFSSPRCLGGEG